MIDLRHGDCLDVLRSLADNSVDSIVTDPPYGLSFMGKRWDYDVPVVEVWRECLRVLKPGGHLLAFAGTRTQHRMAVRIEDAGFEIRDMIAWVYGSGFPKSLDVSKAIDKRGGAQVAWFGPWFRKWREDNGITQKQVATLFPSKTGGLTGCVANWELGFNMPTPEQFNLIRDTFGLPFASVKEAERVVVGQQAGNLLAVAPGQDNDRSATTLDITAPATDAARQWQGWGTALKPALETVTLASKPFPSDMERDTIIANLSTLEARLWLLSFASAADQSSTSSQSGYAEACAIARWTADDVTTTRAALCGQMDTSLFVSALNISLSIVSSWRHTLAEVWRHGSTSTTETKSSTIIDLRTLKFSLSEITPNTIIRACSLPGGFSANASTAESHFNASLSLLQSIHTLSATAPAMSLGQHERQGAGVKPNLDPCIMARKPLDGTVAETVLRWGTGAINVDGGRVEGAGPSGLKPYTRSTTPEVYALGMAKAGREVTYTDHPQGRFPANLIHDGSDEVVGLFPVTGPAKAGGRSGSNANPMSWDEDNKSRTRGGHDDNGGSAARFFYCAKASKSDRDDGCGHLEAKSAGEVTGGREEGSAGLDSPRAGAGRGEGARNHHPTVKPTELMRYLCRLVTPPGGTVLDPFMGSGSTGRGAVLEGFSFIGIEREADYLTIARARIAAVATDPEPEAQPQITGQLTLF